MKLPKPSIIWCVACRGTYKLRILVDSEKVILLSEVAKIPRAIFQFQSITPTQYPQCFLCVFVFRSLVISIVCTITGRPHVLLRLISGYGNHTFWSGVFFGIDNLILL